MIKKKLKRTDNMKIHLLITCSYPWYNWMGAMDARSLAQS